MKPQLNKIQVYSAGLSEDALKRETGYKGDFSRLASNEHPLGPSPKVTDVLLQNINALNYYPDPKALSLKEKLSQFYEVSQDQIFIGAGLDEIIMSISRAILVPGGEVLTSEDTFVQYSTHAIIEDNKIKKIPLKEGRFDLNSIISAINQNTKIIWICNPNNPTGTYVTENELRYFLSRIPKKITVVLDEAYFEFVLKDDYPDGIELLNEYPNLIVLRTFSKAYGLASMRIGYAITSKEYVNEFNKVKLPFNVTTLSLLAAETALDDQEYLDAYIQYNKKRRDFFFSRPYSNHILQSETNFIFVKTDTPQVLFDTLIKWGVISRPTPQGVRITIGTEEDNKKVDYALTEYFNE